MGHHKNYKLTNCHTDTKNKNKHGTEDQVSWAQCILNFRITTTIIVLVIGRLWSIFCIINIHFNLSKCAIYNSNIRSLVTTWLYRHKFFITTAKMIFQSHSSYWKKWTIPLNFVLPIYEKQWHMDLIKSVCYYLPLKNNSMLII